MDLLHSITANWFENECGSVSQRDRLFTGVSCPDRTANLIFPVAISYTMSGLPCGSVNKHTGKSLMSSVCPHGWQEKMWCPERLWLLCSLATNPGSRRRLPATSHRSPPEGRTGICWRAELCGHGWGHALLVHTADTWPCRMFFP